MKTSFTLFLCLGLLPVPSLLQAQEPVPIGTTTTTTTVAIARLSQEDLATLLGPIALYPDPLVAIILPASTYPSDIVLAARLVLSGADPTMADEKPWDSSIKSLVRYPDTLKWMDENLEWTTQLGEAYLAQPEDVMDVIQDLRRKAEAVGNLVDTPQQRIVREETYVRIVPAQPEYIYVPQYDPEIIYIERPYPVVRPLLTFSTGFVIGSWLNFDFDWQRRRLYCGDWHRDRGWDYRRGHDYDRYDRDYDRDYDRRGGDVRINNNSTTIVNNTSVNRVNINNNITNYQVWQGDARRRLSSTRSLTGARGALDSNRTRDGVRDGNNLRNDRNRTSPVLRPQPFTDLASRGINVRRPVDEDGRRPFLAGQTSTSGRGGDRNGPGGDRSGPGGDRNGPGSDNNRGKGGDRDGRGPFVMPRTEAPSVVGDGRSKGGKGSPVRDPKIPDRSGNTPNVRPGGPMNPGSKDFLPDGRPGFPGRGGDGNRDGKDSAVRDPKIPDRGNNTPTVRPAVPVTPDTKDFLPNGRPNGSGSGDGKRGDKDSAVRDPKIPDRGNNTPTVRPAIPTIPSTPGSRDRSPGNDSKGKNDDNDRNRPMVRDQSPGSVIRPSQPPGMPRNPVVSPRDEGGRSPGNKDSSQRPVMPRKENPSTPSVRVPESRPPTARPEQRDTPRSPSARPEIRRDAPKPQVMPRAPEVSQPRSTPQVNRDMPKPKVSSSPVRRDPPKVQSAPPRREAPKVQSAPPRRDPPKVQSAPSKPRSAPQAQRSVPKPQPQVQRSAPKPKPQVQRSAPKPQPQAQRSAPKPKPQASAPSRSAPKPSAKPQSRSSSKEDDKKKERGR